MQKSILIFDTDISGHHLEYMHHLLLKANSSRDHYIFYVPEKFNLIKGNDLDWSYNENVEFFFFNPGSANEQVSFMKKSWRKCRLLRTAIKKHKVSHVFLIALIGFIPFLPFFVSRKLKISGIIYNIYLYRWKKSKIYQKGLDVLKYLILRYASCIDRVYVLNDQISARCLNKIYRTEKFLHLIDPYIPISKDNSINRHNLSIPNNSEVYLHLGDLRERKGTLEILNAIKLCSRRELENKIFIFAGCVHNEIKEELYKLVELVSSQGAQLLIFDKFCEYSFFGSLCDLSDYILIPYRQTGQSTGIIGYAAQFGKPVVGPSTGLIGKLIRRYKLGYALSSTDAEAIYKFLIKKNKTRIISSHYLLDSTVANFIGNITFC